MCWTGVTDAKSLRAKRPYVVVGAFVVGMLLTPPDVISQTLLAIPMWLLFEVGVIIGGLYAKRSERAAEQQSESSDNT
jgi:sec-independent protein translocase protein TatC